MNKKDTEKQFEDAVKFVEAVEMYLEQQTGEG